jgi:hypothetical protein
MRKGEALGFSPIIFALNLIIQKASSRLTNLFKTFDTLLRLIREIKAIIKHKKKPPARVFAPEAF